MCVTLKEHGQNYIFWYINLCLQEWIWPIGFFLRARLHFAPIVGGKEELKRTIESTEAIISRHLIEVSTNHWRGLPELTNEDGEYCKDSCRTQAWSASTVLEVFWRIYYYFVVRNLNRMS